MSSHGRVYSHLKKKCLKPRPNNQGYVCFALKVNKHRSLLAFHRIIAEFFLGPRPLGLVTNHKDGIKAHNYPSNLEYVTNLENLAHAQRLGLTKNGRKGPCGETNSNAKLTNDMVRYIKRALMLKTHSVKTLAAQFHVSLNAIYEIRKERVWKEIKVSSQDLETK